MQLNEKKTEPKANETSVLDGEDSGWFVTASELLRILLESRIINQDRLNCAFCKAAMAMPLDLHSEDCAWRRAWELVNTK